MKKLLLLLPASLLLLNISCQSSGLNTSSASAAVEPASYTVIQLPAEINPAAPHEKARQDRLRQRNDEVEKLYTSGQYDRCIEILGAAVARDSNDITAWYNMACVYAKESNMSEAMRCLVSAVNNGFCDFNKLRSDPDLAALRSQEGYAKLMAQQDEVQRQRAVKIQALLDARLGERYFCNIDEKDRLIFAGKLDQKELDNVRAGLGEQARAEWNDLFSHHIDQYVTVVMLHGPDVKKLPKDNGGFYEDGSRIILTTQTGIILTHEFTHALHHADAEARGQVHPVWIKEGLATLFETHRIEGGHIRPVNNFRLGAIRSAAADGRTLPWRQFFRTTQDDYMKKAQICYPEGRYILVYLWEKGLLKKWYDAYTENYATDRTGTMAMEKVFGKNIEAIQADWLRWLRSDPCPNATPASAKPWATPAQAVALN